jgi:YD repeat-containing protein
VDGLGRLASVCEVAATTQQGSSNNTSTACGLDIAGSGFQTMYGYDVLANLTSVTQAGLSARSFTYDSLSQPLTAFNPEVGSTTSYAYDNDGNVQTRTRPRPNNASGNTVTTYVYDELNRLRTTTYNPAVGSGGYAPSVTYCYDETNALACAGFNFPGVTNTNGRVTGIWTTGTAVKMFSYDSMGRALRNDQCTPSTCGDVRALTYGYDLLGNVLSATDGSLPAGAGHTYTATYNQASRLTSLTSSLNDSQHPGTLLSNMNYGVAGGVGPGAVGLASANINGTLLTETRTYQTGTTVRGFLTGITVAASGTTRYSVTGISYVGDGNITAANDNINGNWTYAYDEFNRIRTSNKTSTPTSAYSYDYDRYGNRWHQTVTAGSGTNVSLGRWPTQAAFA